MPSLPPALRPALRALALAFVPEIALASDAQWARLEQIIGDTVTARPRQQQRQLTLFLRVLDGLARLRFGRPLARLDPVHCLALLSSLAASRLLLLRRGVWGLRTLIQLGWYTQPEVSASLGYRATPAGWARLA